jgi:hypothetical protein
MKLQDVGIDFSFKGKFFLNQMKQEYMYCIWRLSGFCSGIIIWIRTHGTVPGFKQIIIGDKVGFEAKFKITWLKAI